MAAGCHDAWPLCGAGAMSAIGHNNGPPLEPEPDPSWNAWVWRRAHRKAWKTPPREIALRRLARAEELGMTYREYTLEILERGKYL
jgi:hypothetical protein